MGYRQRSGGKRDKGGQSRGEGRTGMGEAEGEDPSRLTAPPTHTNQDLFPAKLLSHSIPRTGDYLLRWPCDLLAGCCMDILCGTWRIHLGTYMSLVPSPLFRIFRSAQRTLAR